MVEVLRFAQDDKSGEENPKTQVGKRTWGTQNQERTEGPTLCENRKG